MLQKRSDHIKSHPPLKLGAIVLVNQDGNCSLELFAHRQNKCLFTRSFPIPISLLQTGEKLCLSTVYIKADWFPFFFFITPGMLSTVSCVLVTSWFLEIFSSLPVSPPKIKIILTQVDAAVASAKVGTFDQYL